MSNDEEANENENNLTIPSEVEESRGETDEQFRGILRLVSLRSG